MVQPNTYIVSQSPKQSNEITYTLVIIHNLFEYEVT